METIKLKFPNAMIIRVSVVLISLILTSCGPADSEIATIDTLENASVNETEFSPTQPQDSVSVVKPEKVPETTSDQQIEVMIPIVESSSKENNEAKNAYPITEQETQDQGSLESQRDETTKPTEETVEEIKPTPRGNDLVATNPSTVNLASGGLQLVELFAFW